MEVLPVFDMCFDEIFGCKDLNKRDACEIIPNNVTILPVLGY